ncbi:hypothetical protein Scep_007770 [Stephania cephalantha]|uniref:Uncharacterized protein n=1 Tax=Stephania cephalantha TaxID=152367 RepID=A0AAP0KCA6_9MAGN
MHMLRSIMHVHKRKKVTLSSEWEDCIFACDFLGLLFSHSFLNHCWHFIFFIPYTFNN